MRACALLSAAILCLMPTISCCQSHQQHHTQPSREPLTSTESRLSRVTKELVRGSTSLPTVCLSQVTGTPAAEKMVSTAVAISGPTPVVVERGERERRKGLRSH